MTDGEPRPSGARFVALGILLSKVGGLVREMVIARFFGVAPHGDVWRTAIRAPNVLQNLLGEQTLSAAFIPVYSRLLEKGGRGEAGRFAGAVFGLLVAAVSVLVLLGVAFAPLIVGLLTPGFLDDAARVEAGEMSVDRFPLTVRAVRVIFPMTGVLVLSAWALGILNSHRRFLLPYLSPVMWNAAIITALVWAAWGSGLLGDPGRAEGAELDGWLYAACVGALVGGLLQFAVQLPLVLRLLGGLRPSLSTRVAGVRQALAALGPALAGRGVVQLSVYVDMLLASLAHSGAPAAVGYAAVLVNLPLSAFGMSVAAAELPELARADPETAGQRIAARIDRALRQSVFVICPAVVGYLLFGFLAAGLVYRGGSFTVEDNHLVYAVLAAYTLGLLPSTASRLAQSSFYALSDTRTPARIAAVRLLVSALSGGVLMWLCDRFSVAEVFALPGPAGDLHMGAVGLGLGSSLGAWCELALLRRALLRRLPALSLPVAHVLRRLVLAALLALPALAVWKLLVAASFTVQALIVLPGYVACYLGYAWWRRLPELDLWLGRLRRRRSPKGAQD